MAAAEAPQTRERQVELGASILTQRALAAYRDGRYVETLHALSERARLVPEQNDLLLIRAWSYLKLGRYDDAGEDLPRRSADRLFGGGRRRPERHSRGHRTDALLARPPTSRCCRLKLCAYFKPRARPPFPTPPAIRAMASLQIIVFDVCGTACALHRSAAREFLPLPRLWRPPALPRPVAGFFNLERARDPRSPARRAFRTCPEG